MAIRGVLSVLFAKQKGGDERAGRSERKNKKREKTEGTSGNAQKLTEDGSFGIGGSEEKDKLGKAGGRTL